MADPVNDGGPAFARAAFALDSSDTRFDAISQAGMSLRDYFAGQVIGAASTDITEPEGVASRAYSIADAMLKAREAK